MGETFAANFNVSVQSVSVLLERGDFCIEDGSNNQRRLLQPPPSSKGKGNDQEATITIVFADAEDARSAKAQACDEVAAEYPESDENSCTVAVQPQGQMTLATVEEKEEMLILGLTPFEF